MGIGTSNITASLGGVTSPPDTLTVTAATLQMITLTPATPSIVQGLTQQFTATGIYSDGSMTDLTSQVTWNSATTTVATINATGLATGVGPGTSNITASLLGITSPIDLLTVTAPACITNPPGLVSWYTADGTTSDFLGANPPVATNAVSYVTGEVGQGFTFGTGGYIDIAASASLENQQFTWSAWARPNGAGPNNDEYGSVVVGQAIDGSDASVQINWRATDNKFLFLFGNVSTEIIASNDAFAPGQFYFVAATYDGATFKLYVNGVLEGQKVESKTIPYAPTTFSIGSAVAFARALGYYRTWNGVIDEVQAFDVPLTQAQIQAIYNNGTGGECKVPLAGIVVSPTPISFGTVSTNTALPVTVTINNTGSAPLTINSITPSGAPFTVTNLPKENRIRNDERSDECRTIPAVG
jgi:hypothetical protein